MGMDVYGKAPTAEAGGYFRNNVWWWHPLWTYVETVAPHLTDGVAGHYNNGDGLTAEGAAELAAILTAELAAGRTAAYASEREAAIAALPDEECWLCRGTGTRTDLGGLRSCNGCGGKGARRPFNAEYPFSVENVAEFRDFVAASGGFEIC